MQKFPTIFYRNFILAPQMEFPHYQIMPKTFLSHSLTQEYRIFLKLPASTMQINKTRKYIRKREPNDEENVIALTPHLSFLPAKDILYRNKRQRPASTDKEQTLSLHQRETVDGQKKVASNWGGLTHGVRRISSLENISARCNYFISSNAS